MVLYHVHVYTLHISSAQTSHLGVGHLDIYIHVRAFAGDKHDYFTPAPYYWPDPKNPKGPYIVMDGQRVPGTGLYDEKVCGAWLVGGKIRQH